MSIFTIFKNYRIRSTIIGREKKTPNNMMIFKGDQVSYFYAHQRLIFCESFVQ